MKGQCINLLNCPFLPPPPVLMTTVVHFPASPKLIAVNIQMELTHKIQTSNLLERAVILCLPPLHAHVHKPDCVYVCVCMCDARALTKTLNIILSGLQPWKQFSAPFRRLSWKLRTKAFWLQCKSLAYKDSPIQIRLHRTPRQLAVARESIVKIAYINALSNCWRLPKRIENYL